MSVKYLLAGEISIGAFAAVYISIDTLFSAMEYFIGSHLGSITNDFGKIRNFLRFMEILLGNRKDVKVSKQNNIIVENAAFKYPNAKTDSIKNINLTIRAGETVAIVGENGAGKTTLVKLLTGMYSPTVGSVKIGQTDLSTISYKVLFENMSGVFQKYQRYALTLKENIRIANFDDNGGDSKIEKVLDENNVDKDNREIFPQTIDTMLSREFDGVELSGGQWQRIAIA